MKTISDIANEFTMKRFKTASQQDGHSDKEYYDLLGDAIYDHVQQQIELAVKKTLEISSENATMKYHCGHTKADKQTKYHQVGADNLQIDKQSILSLRTQILNEIKDR